MSSIHDHIMAEAIILTGNCERLSRFVLDLNAIQIVDYWIVQVPIGLVAGVRRLISKLPEVVSSEDVSQLAWLARNSLELHIWALYVLKSPECARRFHQDAYVDGIELLKLMHRALKEVPEGIQRKLGWESQAAEVELAPVLVRDKVGLTIEELRATKHLSIGAIANEVGHGKVYSMWNPMLSKLVHATAFNVLVAADNMDTVGLHTFNFLVGELRSVLELVNHYLSANHLPTFDPLL